MVGQDRHRTPGAESDAGKDDASKVRVLLDPICPSCQLLCRRARRRGWRDYLWSLIGWYPWRCQQCSVRYYLRCRY